MSGEPREGKASQVSTDPLTRRVLTYRKPRLQPGQSRQLGELGSKPHLFETEKKKMSSVISVTSG